MTTGQRYYYLKLSKKIGYKSNALLHTVLCCTSIILGGLSFIIGKCTHKIVFSKNKKYGLAIVAIAKNEADYIKEWVAYHKLVGVSHIFIYDNGSTDNTKEEVQCFVDSGFVTVIPFPGEKKQLTAYNNAIREYGPMCRYIAFIDCDEFIVPLYHSSNLVNEINKIITQDHNIGGVAINWCMYGSSGYKKKPSGLLTERFLKRADTKTGLGNDCIKTIAIPEYIDKYINPHFPKFKFGFYNVDTQGKIVEAWDNPITEYHIMRINHYFTKSEQQWITRRALGKADKGRDHIRNLDEFYRHDNNDIYDDIMLAYSNDIKDILCNKDRK